MHINLIVVGQRMPAWVNTGYEEFAKRLPRECQLRLIELEMPARQKTRSISQLKQLEGEKIMAAIPKNTAVIALDEHGKCPNTREFSQWLARWMADGRHVSLLVGGPDGLDKGCLEAAEQTWALSPLTFPHPLVRVIIAEQIYRAWSLLQGLPYHRA